MNRFRAALTGLHTPFARLFAFWRPLDPVQKATFVAQLATTGSFLAASIFAYLSWREAAEARLDQRTFFVSEKGPDVSLEGVSVANNNFVLLKIKNSGNSRSTIERITATGFKSKQQIISVPKDAPKPFNLDDLSKNETRNFYLADLEEVVSKCKCLLNARKINIRTSDTFDWDKDGIPALVVIISYRGIFNDTYNRGYVVSTDNP